MKKLIDMIKLARNGDDEAMLAIIEKFNNLINKYVRMMNYNEDCRSELVLKLILIVKNEIDLDKLRSDEDGALVNYISYAMRNHYIAISKANCHIRDNETAYDQDNFVDLLGDKPQETEDIEDWELMQTMRSVLTVREFMCIRLTVFEGWTSEMVAKKLGISKQAVNQSKLRGCNKLKELFE